MNTGSEKTIHLLPDYLINQIAAGEVIQRPADILRELWDNALDAQATHIQTWVIEGGKEEITVMDNGHGMSPIDAGLCFLPHATSKIRSSQDLYHILTRGFRGEALAAIAATCEVELLTRRPSDALGTRVVVSHGKILTQEPIRCSIGTTLHVRNLFHKLPARKKFLRSTAQENRYNLQEFYRITLGMPHIHFSYTQEKRLLWDLQPTTLAQRILDLYPTLEENDLLPVEESTDMLRIYGYLCRPTTPLHGASFFFVNKRYIRHTLWMQILRKEYEPFLGPNQSPAYWIFIEVPPNRVDINIHPAKIEARLQDENLIREFMRSMAKKALYSKVIPSQIPNAPIRLPELPELPEPPVPSAPIPLSPTMATIFPSLPQKETFLPLGKKLFLCLHEEGLWLVDYFAAYQRIEYENTLQNLQNHKLPLQRLLFPQTLALSLENKLLWEEYEPLFRQWGLDYSYHEDKIVVYGLPLGIPGGMAEKFIEDLLHACENATTATLPELWAKYVAYYSMPMQMPQTPQELRALWERLERCKQPDLSPDGNPTRKWIPFQSLENLLTYGELKL
ncbi:MAG: DNA mismatch repair endonuclease MutL [Bacteroidia bacterium]